MPTYDYKCDACGHLFEQWQSFKDDVLTKCPACKKNKLQRLFGGGAAIIFKGSGFYETDYRKESYKTAEKADQAAGKPADAAKPADAPAAAAPKADTPKAEPAKADKPAKGKKTKD